jgi:putative transcriptional regulator
MSKIQITPGHLLIANPLNPKDDLSRAVMLIVSHTPQMSVALQINNLIEELDLKIVSQGLGLDYHFSDPLFYGGNNHTHKIHLVHNSGWEGPTTVHLTDEISVTSDVSVLQAISEGTGPDHYRACAGYWIWKNGFLATQLDPRSTSDPHKWEVTPATMENVFKGSGADQWHTALEDCARYQVSEWF